MTDAVHRPALALGARSGTYPAANPRRRRHITAPREHHHDTHDNESDRTHTEPRHRWPVIIHSFAHRANRRLTASLRRARDRVMSRSEARSVRVLSSAPEHRSDARIAARGSLDRPRQSGSLGDFIQSPPNCIPCGAASEFLVSPLRFGFRHEARCGSSMSRAFDWWRRLASALG